MRTRSGLLPALAMVGALAGCSDRGEQAGADRESAGSSAEGAESAEGTEGDAAVWSLPRGARLSPSTTSFTADVVRLDCNSGVTGEVLEPTVTYDDTRVVVTFAVDPAPGGAADCQGNPPVPFDVVLSEPIGERDLLDGACLDGAEAATTSHCLPDGIRWPTR